MEIEESLATSVSERFNEDGCVAPACLKRGLFSVGALDNIDHNPSSTTSSSSFHGTGISIFQFPTTRNPGESRPPIIIPPSGTERHSLPESFSVVPPVALAEHSVSVPACNTVPVQRCVNEAKAQEAEWVSHVLSQLGNSNVTGEDNLAWSAYHSSIQQPTIHLPAVTALLPLFYEKAATPAMIKHGMDVTREAIAFLNPGQIPVITLDQPLFALAKTVQWKWPDSYGEQKYVVMFGGLNLEMTLWNTLGDLLKSSGWTTALTQAEVASTGVAEAFLTASHVARTRHAHQVSVIALQNLKKEALMASHNHNHEVSMIDWEESMKEQSPTFLFWEMIIRYQTLILIFIRAHRQRNFSLYVDVLERLVPLFFALDHINYARWVPIHIRDMKALPDSIRQEFQERHHWVLSRTNRPFSAMPIDQVHEQENKRVKGSGGAVGLTENPVALRRWMLSGPEVSRILQQFEGDYLNSDVEEVMQNHESGKSSQVTFHRQVNRLCDVIRGFGNPFLDNFNELVTLDSRDCANPAVAETVRTIEEIGEHQYTRYVKDVIVDRTQSIHAKIKKNNLPLFGKLHTKSSSSKQEKKISLLKDNVSLFAQLFVSTQIRESDMKEFFSHEVESFPPSLSEFGELRLPNSKSDLLRCLTNDDVLPEPPHQFDCKVLDGAVVVHCLPTAGIATFDDYADKVFIPHLQQQLQSSHRVDVVWDTYNQDSLKDATRDKRGYGVRRKVSGQVKLPTNWNKLLRDPDNKTELFSFLSDKVARFDWPTDKAIYITSGTSVISSQIRGNPMPECNHEEADTRIVVHLVHALEAGASSVVVRTVDTDVVVILVGKFHDLTVNSPHADIWVAFGMGKHFTFKSVNDICSRLGESKARSLPFFHALTGCDTTSSFCGRGKKTAWQVWKSSEQFTQAFISLATEPFQQLDVTSQTFKIIERMTVLLYDKLSPLDSVNAARMLLFCKQNRSLENIPPTQDALLQHTKRAVHQAGVWTTSDQTQQVIPSPQDFGWKMIDGSWKPHWMSIQKVSNICRELLKCACKKTCSRCKCVKAQLQCTPLCKCNCKQSQP